MVTLAMSIDGPGGDFATLRQLAANTRVNIQSSPLGWRRTEETVDSLNTLLERLNTDLNSSTSILKRDTALQHQLDVHIKLCLVSLTKLSVIVEKAPKSEIRNFENADRAETSTEDIDERDEVHRELLLRYNDLANFLSNAGFGDMAKKENENEVDSSQEDQRLILEAVHTILTDESVPQETSEVLAGNSNDHGAVWKHLREKLKIFGFKSSDIERHKAPIFDKLYEILPLNHSSSSGAFGSQSISRPSIAIPETVEDVRRRTVPITFREHLERQTFNSGRQYKRPTASTVYDDSDDDARSVTSDASTLLGPVDENRSSGHYVLRPPTTSRPSSRNTQYMAEPRSPLSGFGVTDDKFLDLSSSPRASGPNLMPQRGYSNYKTLNESARSRPLPRNVESMPSPNSPRERDQRFGALPHQPSYSRTPTASSKYDFDVLVGRRSTVNPVWRYRRNDEATMFPRRNQSMDVQDDALPSAAADGRMNDVERLLRDGRNIESFGSRTEQPTQSFNRTTAVFRAARRGHFKVVQLLLRHGANPNPRRKDDKSLVRLLADDGSVEMLRLVLEYGADVQNQGALPQAALFGHSAVVQLLLEYGANVDEIDKQTALYRASSKNFPQIVELLLREGADPKYTTTSGQSALYKAVQNENYQCASLLLSYGARPNVGIGRSGETILHLASDLGDEPIARALLRRGAVPNEFNGYQNGSGTSEKRRVPLHIAARGGHLGAAKVLLEYGANPNALTEDGRGPVDIALERGHLEMADLLDRAGGSPQQAVHERGIGYRAGDIDNPRRSNESQQLRRYSSSFPERPYRERRPNTLQPCRPSFEQEPARRSRSSAGARRSENSSQQQGSSSKINGTALGGLLASSLMILGGG